MTQTLRYQWTSSFAKFASSIVKGGRDMSVKRILSIVIPVVGTIVGAILTGICDYQEHLPSISDESQNNEKETE